MLNNQGQFFSSFLSNHVIIACKEPMISLNPSCSKLWFLSSLDMHSFVVAGYLLGSWRCLSNTSCSVAFAGGSQPSLIIHILSIFLERRMETTLLRILFVVKILATYFFRFIIHFQRELVYACAVWIKPEGRDINLNSHPHSYTKLACFFSDPYTEGLFRLQTPHPCPRMASCCGFRVWMGLLMSGTLTLFLYINASILVK